MQQSGAPRGISCTGAGAGDDVGHDGAQPPIRRGMLPQHMRPVVRLSLVWDWDCPAALGCSASLQGSLAYSDCLADQEQRSTSLPCHLLTSFPPGYLSVRLSVHCPFFSLPSPTFLIFATGRNSPRPRLLPLHNHPS